MKTFQFPAEGLSDAYKAGMSALHDMMIGEHSVKITSSYSNFTPRKNGYMKFSDLSDGHIVVYGLLNSFKVIVALWQETFFDVEKEVVMDRLRKRTIHIFGTLSEHSKFLQDMSDLHDIGYLPIEIRSIDEGTKYPLGLPVFTAKSTLKGFGWLVNYLEPVSSGLVWPMINTATKVEQFYLQASHYGRISAPKDVYDIWLPTCVHEFGMRGFRGIEDQVRTSSACSLFFAGSDTMSVVDFFQHYYGSDIESEVIAKSVRATEHADISRILSTFRYLASQAEEKGAQFLGVDPKDVLKDTELYALKWFVENSTGIISYVSDVEDYYRLINDYADQLKDLIKARKAREDGQPAIFVFRPDSSRHSPLHVICGYTVYSVEHFMDAGDHILLMDTSGDKYVVLNDLRGNFLLAEWTGRKGTEDGERTFKVTERISEWEAKGSLESLWDIFGGDIKETESGMLRFIDNSVGLIYGEAISQSHQVEIYERMIQQGFSVTNLVVGKGSYASLENSTRDLFSMAYKQTFSTAIIDGEEVDLAMFKKPMGDASKASAKGLLRVEKTQSGYVLHQNQTEEQESEGELTLLLRDGVFYKNQTLEDIKLTYANS